MANENSSSNFTNNGIVLAALAVSGALYFYHNRPLRGARPEMTETQLHETASQQNIEARLWQDPFAAIAKYARESKDADRDDSGKCSEKEFKEQLSGSAEVLGVMLPGGPYAELSEARRRTRFAVLSGLERQDFIGQTQDHIGCWAPEIADNPFTPREIPFEWFNQKSDKKRRILVLWLNEDLFDQWPLKGISSVLDKLGTTSTVKIVGPYTSNVLESMIEEAPPKNEAPPKKAKPLLRERHAPYQMVAAARTQGEGRSSSSSQRTPAFVRVSVAEVDPSPNNINQQSSACPISQRDQKEKTGWNRLDRVFFYSYGATTDQPRQTA